MTLFASAVNSSERLLTHVKMTCYTSFHANPNFNKAASALLLRNFNSLFNFPRFIKKALF